MSFLKKLLIIFLKKSENLSALSCHLTKITGKSQFPTHPKHLIKKDYWYLKWLKKDDWILDVGCGNGEHSLKMARACKEVVAFDVNEEGLRQAREKQKREKIKNIKFLKADANKKFPFKDNFFDVVFAHDVLEHVKDYRKTTGEITRILKRGGLFLLTLPNAENSWKRLKKQAGQFWFSDRGHVKEWSLKEMDEFPKTFALELVAKEPIVYDTPLSGFIDLLGGVSLFLYQKLLTWKGKKAQENPRESTGFRLVLKK